MDVDYGKLMLNLRQKYVDLNSKWDKLIDFAEDATNKYEKDGNTTDLIELSYRLLEHNDDLDNINEKYLTYNQLSVGGDDIQWN